MQKRLLLLIVSLILISNISATCENGQIDINSASKNELDKLYGIGPAKAASIINSRPFDSVDDLINVNGIGEITLEKIKDQGLACVEDFEEGDEKENKEEDEDLEEKEEEKLDEESNDESEEEEDQKDVEENSEEVFKKKEYNVDKEIIILNPKDIKTEKSIEDSSKNNYAIYGLFSFCILLGFLYFIKEKQRYSKNEFK